MPRGKRTISDSLRSTYTPLHLRWIDSDLLRGFELAHTDTHRLASSAGAWIERFGPDILINYAEESTRDQLVEELQRWSENHALSFRRTFVRYLPRQNEDRAAPQLLIGDPNLPLTTTVSEENVTYEIDFSAGYSVGLFLDQRANRRLLRGVAPRQVLNTFAYTCSFSLVAALAGAETVSIDLSRKSLDRGRANFRLNELDDSKHRFLADDVMDVLPRLARRGEKFDAIVLDPPTFSRGNRGRRFQVEHDLESLVSAALELLAPEGRILLSTNCTRLNSRDLEQLARYALKLSRRTATFHREPELPDIPGDLAARTLWMVFR
jgi:23S rRNA (cytosine1962-C5)-methyltransferase